MPFWSRVMNKELNMCEVGGCDQPKHKSVITEYSCFGHEYMDLCEKHHREHVIAKSQPTCGYCDRCGNPEAEDIRPFQDPEEGSAAAYLDTCASCRKSIRESFCDD